MNRTTTIAVSSQQSAVSKSRESEFPPTEERSAVSKRRELEFALTEDPLVTNPPNPSCQGAFSVVKLLLD